MDRVAVVEGVKTQAGWWLDERLKKIRQEKHDTMEVNPFMAPLVSRVCRILCKRTIHRRRKPACPQAQ